MGPHFAWGVCCGIAGGEGPLLDSDEKLELLRIAAPLIQEGRVLIADVSSEGVRGRRSSGWRRAAEAGAHAVISTPPHEYRDLMCAPETRTLFFRALADQSPVPVLIRNDPETTGVDLAANEVARLAEHPNIAGVVETGTPASRVAELREIVGRDFAILAGTEASVWDSLKGGANGAVLAFASTAPYATIAIWEAFRTREDEAGMDRQSLISHPSLLIGGLYGASGLKHPWT